MDKELYLIHLDDYLNHIDHKLEMYDLLLEMVRTMRQDLAEGETARAVRNLCAYEQEAHLLFECWTIPDEYVESGDPDDLSQLMEKELLPLDDEDGEELDGGNKPLSELLLNAADLLTHSAIAMMDAGNRAADLEREAVLDQMDEMERPENDCAG